MQILSIIIVTYFSDNFIKECLDSIFLHNDLDEKLEVIIVDNSPYTTNYLKETVKQFLNVRLIFNPKNVGFGQGNNIGADAASGEILLFLNPDTKLIEPVFSEVVEYFNKHEDIGAIGCQLVDGEGRKNNTYGYFPEKWNIFVSIIDKCIFKPLGYIPKYSIYPWGANYFVRKKDFYAAGKFDEEFFICFEEADLCKRIRPKGTHIIKKKIIHYGGHTTVEINKRFDAWLKSLLLYHKKYGYNLNRTLRRYKLALLLPLTRCFLLGQDHHNFQNMINRLNFLKNSLTK